MKHIVSMNLGLENMEEIALRPNEFADLNIENIKESVAQFNNDVLQFHTCDFVYFRLNSHADHTYSSFGDPSELTTFKRLTSVDNPITDIELVYDDDTTLTLFLSDSMSQSFSVDSYGDLTAIFVQCDDDCCGCEDCEE